MNREDGYRELDGEGKEGVPFEGTGPGRGPGDISGVPSVVDSKINGTRIRGIRIIDTELKETP